MCIVLVGKLALDCYRGLDTHMNSTGQLLMFFQMTPAPEWPSLRETYSPYCRVCGDLGLEVVVFCLLRGVLGRHSLQRVRAFPSEAEETMDREWVVRCTAFLMNKGILGNTQPSVLPGVEPVYRFFLLCLPMLLGLLTTALILCISKLPIGR